MFKHPFYAMRHGETSWNARKLFQGHADIPLSLPGRQQAARNGRRLREVLPRFENDAAACRIFSSPFARAIESARLVSGEIGAPETEIVTDARLREVSFGLWEGLNSQEVKDRFPEERRLRKVDRWNFSPQGGGSHADIAREVESFLVDLDWRAPVPVIVTHSGNLRTMLNIVAGLTQDFAVYHSIPHDRVFYWNGQDFEWI